MFLISNSATNATSCQLSTTLAEVVDEINPAQDLQRLRQLTNATLAQAIPKRTLYYNYQVGECKDMLFGVSLVDYASSRGLKDNELPKIVELCIAEVEARGLKTEGIYRASLAMLSIAIEINHVYRFRANIQPLWRCVPLKQQGATLLTWFQLSLLAERDEGNFQFDHARDDIHCVASLLKVYCPSLPASGIQLMQHV